MSANTTNDSTDMNYDESPNYDDIFPSNGEWVLISVYIITFFVGLIGNCLVCFAIWRNKNMRTVTNMFIVNLSVADLAVIIVCLPSVLLVDVTLTWFLGTVLCKIYSFLMTFSVSVSVMTLSAISVERWYAICHPLRFHSTVRRARVIIVVIWILSASLAMPETISSRVKPYYNDSVLYSSCYPVLMDDADFLVVFQICVMVLLYFLPLCLMAFTYTHIGIVLMKGDIPGETRTRQPMLQGKHHHHDNEDQHDARKKAAKMLCAIVIVFAVCFFPNYLLNIFRYTGNLNSLKHVDIYALFAHWAVCLNSCINPVIYNFMSDKFRKEFRKTVGWCLKCKCGQESNSLWKTDAYKVTFTNKAVPILKRMDATPTHRVANGHSEMGRSTQVRR